jgi:methylenetetrahydrofolate--tRNA-(uracil-5-)-methyltransferase
MKPVGLIDPKTGRCPYAAAQLRQDSVAADLFNMVGFQTRMAQGAQAEVLRLIPGLEGAVFARCGSIHRNTYICAPRLLDATLEAKAAPGLFFAGQLSGAEGYLESAATGLAAAMAADRRIKNLPPLEFPRQTMIGSMLHYLARAEPSGFAPINAMMGLLPELPKDDLDIASLNKNNGAKSKKAAKRALLRKRALAAMGEFVARSQ